MQRNCLKSGFGAELSALLCKAPTLMGTYNMAYLVRVSPSPKSPSATSDMPRTLFKIARGN